MEPRLKNTVIARAKSDGPNAGSSKAAPKEAGSSKATPGMSDDAVAERTGKTWPEWFSILDAAGAAELDHREIVKLLDSHDIGPWWRQMVTVAYERARGKRQVHEKATGFSADVSRTVSATLEAAYGAWEKPTRRKKFLTEAISFSTRRDGKTLRFGWPESTSRVSVAFTARSKTRTQVVITHEKLKSERDVTRMKAFWSEALDRMQALVEKVDD
jgi:hypothetical protein